MRAVILDMDGTACDVRTIRHYVLGKERNFHKFHTESVNCPPNPAVIEQVREDQANGLALLVVTAREFRFAMHTMFWLSGPEVNLQYDELYMRRTNDFRPDYVVKREILQMIRRDGYVPVKAYDDNPAIWQLWEEEEIPTIRVEGFGFEEAK